MKPGSRGLFVGRIVDQTQGVDEPFALMVLDGAEKPDDTIAWVHWPSRWPMVKVGLRICWHALRTRSKR